MISITRHIEYLITCHDCVIVPGWGAFIANSVPSRIVSDSSGVSTIFPPTRTLSFNPGINHNDGLLVTSIMRREGVSYEIALQEIERQVSTLRRQLEQENEIAIPLLGSFTLNRESWTPVFSPADSTIASVGYYGLPRIHPSILPVVNEISETTGYEDTDTENYSVSESITENLHDGNRWILPPFVRKAVRVAASVVLLVGLGVVLTTPITVDRSGSNFASVDPSAAIPKVSGPKPAKPAPVYSAHSIPANAELVIALPSEELSETETNTEIPGIQTEIESTSHYYLIVASLESRRRADKFLELANDPNLQILNEDGRYRIYAAIGNSVEEASKLKDNDEFSFNYPDAWVYHLKK